MRGKKSEREARRLILIQLVLDLHALIQDAKIPFEMALVMMAIRQGQYQRKAMDVSDIASVTHIPISSVSRHIRVLRKLGRVRSVRSGRRILQHIPLGHEPVFVTRFYERFEEVMTRSAHDVSILGRSTVDKN